VRAQVCLVPSVADRREVGAEPRAGVFIG
jgi:hypothetical protein